LLGAVFLLFDTDSFFGSLVKTALDWQIDTATIGKVILSILLFTSKIIFSTLTILVALLRSVIWATVGASALGFILHTHSAFASVVEAWWACVGNWAVFGIDSA